MDEITDTAAPAVPTGLRRHRLLLGLAGGTLVLGLAAGAGTVFALDGRSASPTATAADPAVRGASFFPPGIDYSVPNSGSGSQTPAIAASADLQVGMVTIDTVLGYQGA